MSGLHIYLGDIYIWGISASLTNRLQNCGRTEARPNLGLDSSALTHEDGERGICAFELLVPVNHKVPAKEEAPFRAAIFRTSSSSHAVA